MKRRPTSDPLDQVAHLCARARRHRRRQEHRRAMLALREAAQLASDDASLWTLHAAACLRLGRFDEAASSLKQALWLRKRTHDGARSRVTQALLDSVRQSATLKAA